MPDSFEGGIILVYPPPMCGGIKQCMQQGEINMPFISVNVTKALDEEQRNRLKTALGQAVSMLPGKEEATLMVDISDNHTIYLGGVQQAAGAYVDVKIYGAAGFAAKQRFTEAALQAVSGVCGIPTDHLYLTFSQMETWGAKGTLK